MQTVAQNTHAHKFPTYEPMAEAQARRDYAADRQRHPVVVAAPVRHYATYHAIAGVVEQTARGATFYADGNPQAWDVDLTDAALVLLGRTDLADAQRAADEFAGGLAALVCGRAR